MLVVERGQLIHLVAGSMAARHDVSFAKLHVCTASAMESMTFWGRRSEWCCKARPGEHSSVVAIERTD